MERVKAFSKTFHGLIKYFQQKNAGEIKKTNFFDNKFNFDVWIT